MNRYSFLTKLVTDKFKLYTLYLKKGFPVGGDPTGTGFAGQHGYFSQLLGKGNPHEYLQSNMKII